MRKEVRKRRRRKPKGPVRNEAIWDELVWWMVLHLLKVDRLRTSGYHRKLKEFLRSQKSIALPNSSSPVQNLYKVHTGNTGNVHGVYGAKLMSHNVLPHP
jgi:hypothetical protein